MALYTRKKKRNF